MSAGPADDGAATDGVVHVVRESFLTGVAVVAPALVTLYLLTVAVNFVLRTVRPLARVALLVLVPSVSESVAEVGAGVALVGFVFVVGFVTHFHAGEFLVDEFDTLVTRIPLLGTVYGSFRRISDAVFGGDERSFRDVALVELPATETYMLGFRIADADDAVSRAADGGDLRAVFVPLAPNPVMAGFLVHVPEDRVRDVDLTVEQGVSAIVSLGATEDDDVEEAWTTPGDR